MISAILRWLNPCLHTYETLATLKDDEVMTQAVKIIQVCTACGHLRERVITAPGWCGHKWQTLETIRVFRPEDDEHKDARPIGICKIQRCEKCGSVKRVDLYNKEPVTEPGEKPPALRSVG